MEDIILCDGNYGVGAYHMEWVHNREPERSSNYDKINADSFLQYFLITQQFYL